ncbi:unnamed protein product [Allacma fusca]|uniref:Uncharacterized protein n=1 Tax=Allacma fusca TaxID=39272 RepID=A0A8J2KMJ6_9HEXA|nr:unnamed protein product [Allacma fusca]
MQRIKFSDYEAKQISEFAEKTLIQIDQHKRCGKKFSDPLLYFADDEARVRAFDPKNVREFWAAEPDLETCSVRLRLQFNPRNGNFEFGLLNPVPDDICERFNNWAV